MSDGLYEAYATCIQTRNPPELHNALAKLVADEMKCHKSIERVAQAVINRVKGQYKEFHRATNARIGRLDDISLVVQNFSYNQNPEGVFVAEDMSPVDRLVPSIERLKMVPNDFVGSDKERPPVELTKEQIDSGKYIAPYISFPNSFPFDLGLDDL